MRIYDVNRPLLQQDTGKYLISERIADITRLSTLQLFQEIQILSMIVRNSCHFTLNRKEVHTETEPGIAYIDSPIYPAPYRVSEMSIRVQQMTILVWQTCLLGFVIQTAFMFPSERVRVLYIKVNRQVGNTCILGLFGNIRNSQQLLGVRNLKENRKFPSQ